MFGIKLISTLGLALLANAQSSSNIWQPEVGTKWHIVLHDGIKGKTVDAPIYDIDLVENSGQLIKGLQDEGIKVICYFSAGSYESYRPDSGDFKESDLGNTLDGWEDERWLDIRSDNVRQIMINRLDMAVDKNCDGVDPDNVDGYGNDNGLQLTDTDSVDYVNFLAEQAHSRGLAIGLKNAGAIISRVLSNVQFSVNEECDHYEECDDFQPFINASKPVFHIEYPKGEDVNDNKPVDDAVLNKICQNKDSQGFSTVIKNMDLDEFAQYCN